MPLIGYYSLANDLLITIGQSESMGTCDLIGKCWQSRSCECERNRVLVIVGTKSDEVIGLNVDAHTIADLIVMMARKG